MSFMNLFAVGLLIGIGSVAPGVSGGSMAIAFGIYEKIVEILTNFREQLRSKLHFLMPLAIGGIIGIGIFLLGLNLLFDKYEFFMRFLFAGIMVGTFPSVYSASTANGYKGYYPLIFIASMLLFLFGYELIGGNFDREITPVIAAICGIVIGIGTIIPGISASAVLMAFGLYKPLLASIGELKFAIIIPAALGFGMAVALLLKTVKWLFFMYHGEISFLLFGFLGGSVAAIIPKIYVINVSFYIALTLSILGAILSYHFGKKAIHKSCD